MKRAPGGRRLESRLQAESSIAPRPPKGGTPKQERRQSEAATAVWPELLWQVNLKRCRAPLATAFDTGVSVCCTITPLSRIPKA